MATPPLTLRTVSPEELRAAKRGSFRDLVRELRALFRTPEAAALARAAAERPVLRRAGSRVLRFVPRGSSRAHGFVASRPVPSVGGGHTEVLPSPELAGVQTSGAIFRASALRSLGWTPPVDVDRAFGLTAEWLRFAREL
jgi:hypothetical protein